MALSLEQRDVLCVLGYTFIQHRHYDKATTLLEALQVLYPDDAYVHKTLSYLYLSARRYGESLALSERCEAALAEPAPRDQQAALALLQSRALWGLERSDEARARLRRFIDFQESRQ